MIKRLLAGVVLAILMPLAAAAQPGITGTWQGILEFQGQQMRLVFHLAESADGLEATMDSPDQGVTGVPLPEVHFDGDTLRLALPSAGLTYHAALERDGTLLSGTFRQGGLTLPLMLERTDEVVEVRRPQTPEPPFPYAETEVSYPQEQAGFTIGGTLTIPEGDGPHPAVLLITGSGAQDRDESLAGHQPFRVLADHLARSGIAVLRVDDRGIGATGGTFAGATSADFAEDVKAGVAFLRTHPEVNPERVGLIGHSEGGIIAPMVAAETDDVAFIVLMAGTGVTGLEVIKLQSELIGRASGEDEEALERARAVNERVFNALAMDADSAQVVDAAREILMSSLEEMTDEERSRSGMNEQLLESRLQMFGSTWFRYFLTHDPGPVLESVRVPVLAINGELDLQVDAAQNLTAIAAALERGGNTNYTIAKLPRLNHLFQTAETGSPAEYGAIEETFAPLALHTISDWIIRQLAYTVD